ncbi:putative spermidine/putrescine transport system permease protein [Rhodoligotrophos appendicifer]|uniref:ABC transporter permease n=1 Tax=Rhodoligotrophos appendicifer TaxID=987056 RepID=UPI001185B654|nr:ABC transporter permease [Rhodoligotrophos appendicifer]
MSYPAINAVTRERGSYWKLRLSSGWLILPAMMFVVAFFIIPLLVMVERSLFDPSPENYSRFFESSVYPRAMFFTLWMAALVTALCLALGFPYAYLTYRLAGTWQWVLIVLVLLPFWSSLLVRTYAWTILLRDSGLINWALIGTGLIDRPVKLMGNTLGIVVGMTHVLLPFMVLPIIAAMRRFDENLFLAASGLGAPPLTAFWRIFFPLCLPGVLAGCLLVFVLAVGFYITPAILGGRTAFFSLLIVMQVNKLLDFGFGSALGVILLLVVLAAVALGSRLVRLETLFDQGQK